MKLKIFTSLLLLALAVNISAQTSFSKQKEDSLFSILSEKDKAMGSIAVLEKGNVIYAKAIGYRQLSPVKVPSDIHTKYRIGSITKMFTSTMLLQLVEEGKLQLTQTLDKFFPSIPNASKITIGNMMNHRSGIHNFTNDPQYQTYMTQPKTRSEMVGIIAATKPDFEPGEKFQYSNSNYVLLGYIVEDLRKVPYKTALQTYICKKAGLTETYYGDKADISKNESYSFTYAAAWDRQPETDMSIPHGAGAIVSTPSDLVKFINALFSGVLIKPASLDKMKTISDGMGLGIMQFPYDKKIVYGHGGGIDGFNSILIYIPEDGLAVAYCSNGTIYAVNDILLRTLNNYYGKKEKLPEFKTYKVDPAVFEKYTGVYSSPELPIKLTIKVNGERLFGQGEGQPPFPLEASAKDEFRFEPAGIVIKFMPEKDQLTLSQGGRTNLFTREKK
jgi:CubicO group peptidase (beta-lactamase class C family)